LVFYFFFRLIVTAAGSELFSLSFPLVLDLRLEVRVLQFWGFCEESKIFLFQIMKPKLALLLKLLYIYYITLSRRIASWNINRRISSWGIRRISSWGIRRISSWASGVFPLGASGVFPLGASGVFPLGISEVFLALIL